MYPYPYPWVQSWRIVLSKAISGSINPNMTTDAAAVRRGRGADANKIDPSDLVAHGWYRFVLSYPPHLVRDYLERFDIRSDQCVLDPFCGTGTTPVECKKLGIPSIGVEANPVAAFASATKVDWSPKPGGLLEHARRVSTEVSDRLKKSGIEDAPFFSMEPQGNVALRGLPPDQQRLLLADSISPRPLHKTLELLDGLRSHSDPRYTSHERLALASALVSSIGNLKFGPEVGVGPIKKDAAVVEPWLGAVQTMTSDLHQLGDGAAVPARIFHADARSLRDVVPPASIDAVITSPPYPNEKDYTRTTRLESVLLGFVESRAELRELKKTLVRSNTRGVYKGDDDDQWIADHPEIHDIAKRIEQRRIDLNKTSGFERMYARVAKLYFGGMAKHLAELRPVLRPGAQLAYVVGDQASYLRVMIRTGQLLADIADSLGYQVVGIDLFRTRLATATREQLREEVVVLRWPGAAG